MIPCPHCGTDLGDSGLRAGTCPDCGHSLPDADTIKTVAELWQGAVAPDAQPSGGTGSDAEQLLGSSQRLPVRSHCYLGMFMPPLEVMARGWPA